MASSQSKSMPTNNESSPTLIPEEMGLEEVIRVMDVASALRREQELVDREFNLDKTKELLREKLRKTAALTGETLTPEQIEAAVDWYYENLHEYEEPKKSLQWFLAHLYVARGRILKIAVPLVAALATVWSLWFAPFAPFSAANQKRKTLSELRHRIENTIDAANALDLTHAAKSSVEQLHKEFNAYWDNQNLDAISSVAKRLDQLYGQINETYTITVVSGENRQSATRRDFTDNDGTRVSGHYLLVQALDSNGQPLTREILNNETNTRKSVTTWGERVPASVYNRLAQDKKQDGILNETIFAKKERGALEIEIIMQDAEEISLQRAGQITDW